ncbi:MAG: hypothetical protein JW757_09380 [Anaerolineales bacterium]|nr:hypothetical protein [Anaerolineales bacterium]
MLAVDTVLEKIEEKFGRKISRVISPLAEGTDRLVVHCLIDNLPIDLIVPLPADQQTYLEDFNSEKSKKEYQKLISRAKQVIDLTKIDSSERNYLGAGRYVLENCDVLLAIWDGKPSRGAGGTGQIVEEARGKNLPVAWIKVADQQVHADKEQIPVKIIYERFPE